MSNTKVQQNLNELFNVDPIPQSESLYQIAKTDKDEDDFDIEAEGGKLVPVDADRWKAEDEQIKSDIDDDYHQVRSNLKGLLNSSESMLELAMQIAQGTENPKSIDSVTKLIGQIADINTKIIDLTAKKQDVYIKARPKVNTKFAEALNGDPAVIGSVTNNNTMFVGSVTDLLKQLQTLEPVDGVVNEKNGSETSSN